MTITNGQVADADQVLQITKSWIHTLTAGEKTNGVQVQLSSTSGGAAGTSTWANIQSIIEVKS